MTQQQAQRLVSKSLDQPDETRPIPGGMGTVQVVQLAEATVMRATFQPGWRWSEHVKPIAGTPSCQVAHTGYIVSGRLHVRMDDGTEVEMGPGEASITPPGHDAWVVGNEPVVFLDFAGAATYAKPR